MELKPAILITYCDTQVSMRVEDYSDSLVLKAVSQIIGIPVESLSVIASCPSYALCGVKNDSESINMLTNNDGVKVKKLVNVCNRIYPIVFEVEFIKQVV